MKKHNKPWEDSMGSRLQNLQGEPAFDAWERIEAELEEKPKRMAWFWVAATIAMLAAPTAFYLWQTNQGHANEPMPMAKHDPAAAKAPAVHSPAAPVATSPAPAYAMDELVREVQPDQKGSRSMNHGAKEAVAAVSETATSKGNEEVAGASVFQQESQATKIPSGAIAQEFSASKSGSAASGSVVATGSTEEAARSARAAAGRADAMAGSTSVVIRSAGTAARDGAVPERNQTIVGIASVAPAAFPLAFNLEAPTYKPSYETDKEMVVLREKSKDKEKGTLAQLWIEAMPTWSYRRIEPSQTDAVVMTAMEDQSALSSSRMGGQLAAGVSYPLGKKLQWKTGAYYWYQQQNWSYTYHSGKATSYRASLAAADNFSVTPEFNEQTQTVDMTHHNVGVSTGLSYKLTTKFAPSFLETRVHAQYNAQQEISSLLSFGYTIEARLDQNTRLTFGPSLQLQLNNNQNLSPHFEDKPMSAGVQMGVIF